MDEFISFILGIGSFAAFILAALSAHGDEYARASYWMAFSVSLAVSKLNLEVTKK